jgi:deoxyribodipyrimidine photo-lyase
LNRYRITFEYVFPSRPGAASLAMPTSIVWFRSDLRLSDHDALREACARGSVIPVFVWAPDEETPWPPGAAARVWLHRSLSALAASLAARGSRLIVREGPTTDALVRLCGETGADAVFWTRRYEPSVAARDARVAAALRAAPVEVRIHGGGVLLEPEALSTSGGRPYQVFTPFARAAVRALGLPRVFATPREIPAPLRWPQSVPIETLPLRPKEKWAAGFFSRWSPGENGGQAALRAFVETKIDRYAEARDVPASGGSSSLSPHLRWGELSPRQVWQAADEAAQAASRKGAAGAASAFQRQLLWREFAVHLLHHFPHTDREPLRAPFGRFPWRCDAAALRAWQRGCTGYPMVDAGMRELWTTGFMHNRVRMIVGSFLVKDLLLPWQEGARWFWDTLVDADLANNTMGWQWVAGSGADAAPYFRVLNPHLQQQKFDPDGAYVRRWVPELGSDAYPQPIVDHAAARQRALAALAAMARSDPNPRP